MTGTASQAQQGDPAHQAPGTLADPTPPDPAPAGGTPTGPADSPRPGADSSPGMDRSPDADGSPEAVPGTPPTAAPAPTPAAWARRDSPIGPLLLAATDRGLVKVAFHADERRTRRTLAQLTALLGAAPVADPSHPVLVTAATELDAYFGGTLRAFSVPLDWRLTTAFHRRVLQELADGVRYGEVAGYQDLADRVGEPGAARAVGVAMGANPLPVVVPCHRVVASDGGIGGFGGGLETKRTLLALEGVLPAPLF